MIFLKATVNYVFVIITKLLATNLQQTSTRYKTPTKQKQEVQTKLRAITNSQEAYNVKRSCFVDVKGRADA